MWCSSSADCASGLCDQVCRPSSCANGEQDGDETDVDCGGPWCAACPTGSTCAIGVDCLSDHCVEDTCAPPGPPTCHGSPCGEEPASCTNGIQDGDETDVDCGGSCFPCFTGGGCVSESDCANGEACVAGICTPPAGGCEGGGGGGGGGGAGGGPSEEEEEVQCVDETENPSKAFDCGTLRWNLWIVPKAAMGAQITFEPSNAKECKCDQIAFLQVVELRARVGTPKEMVTLKPYPFDNSDPDVTFADDDDLKKAKKEAEFYKLLTDLPNKKGWFVDVVEGDNNPYYALKYADGKLASSLGAKIGKTPPPTNALLSDSPQIGGVSGSGTRPQTMMFETCAVCVDTKKVLGCLNWGFKLEDPEKSVATMLKGKDTDTSATASADLKDAVKRWDALAKKKEGYLTVGDLK